MSSVALLSNPRSTGNRSLLPRVRSFCAEHHDIFHYEVEHAHQIGQALRTIARVKPRVLVINGGDGTVQAVLTELHHGGHFGDNPPPVAVLPNGKTNLIAHDLGASGDPIEALQRVLDLSRTDIVPHIVSRELIALTGGKADGPPVLGMFLGGAGLADTILYCRHKIYPLGLPNSVSHALTFLAYITRLVLKLKSGFLPQPAEQTDLELHQHGRISGRFAFLAVTTLDKLLLSGQVVGKGLGPLKLVAIEESTGSVFRALLAGLTGGYKGKKVRGFHFEEVDEITIEGDRSNVILDGETFSAGRGSPINLTTAQPLSFVKLAA